MSVTTGEASSDLFEAETDGSLDYRRVYIGVSFRAVWRHLALRVTWMETAVETSVSEYKQLEEQPWCNAKNWEVPEYQQVLDRLGSDLQQDVELSGLLASKPLGPARLCNDLARGLQPVVCCHQRLQQEVNHGLARSLRPLGPGDFTGALTRAGLQCHKQAMSRRADSSSRALAPPKGSSRLHGGSAARGQSRHVEESKQLHPCEPDKKSAASVVCGARHE